MMCSIANSGTMNAGINTSGSRPIGAIVGGTSVVMTIAQMVAVVKAMTKSSIPNAFQSLKPRVAAAPGSLLNATIHHGATIPIAMSPRPAGHANSPGNT